MATEISFGQWLKQRRKTLDMTQDELAERVGCAVETIRKVEADQRRPSRDIAEHLARELVADPEERATVVRHARTGEAADVSLRQPVDMLAHNFPLPSNPLIGREREVAQVVELIVHPHVRLLTLTGPGGTGKTRLAIQAAPALSASFAQGVWWVSLAAIREAELVPMALTQALGVQEVAGQPAVERLKEFLRDKELLVVLDNFEQVVEAAPLLADLLQAAPKLKLLVTSRITLHLAAEHELLVPPLTLPPSGAGASLSALTQYESVTLFIQRAQAVLPSFQVTNATAPAVAEICHRLDGLPLAIELAAARSKLFAPQALLKRLSNSLTLLTGGTRDVPARQQTLRATIAWSYDLLPPAQQALFRQLAVFAGGWTLEAAEAICITPAQQTAELPLTILDGLQALLDQHLVRQAPDLDGEPRFVLLETIREYALDQLEAIGEARQVLDRHAQYYLNLAREAEPALWGGPGQLEWLARLEADHDNLRRVLQASLDGGQGEIALAMAATVWRFWMVHGHMLEGQRWLERSLAVPAAAPLVRAHALCGLGSIAAWQLDGTERFVRALEESVALFREHGGDADLATALWSLGYSYSYSNSWLQNNYEGARAVCEESLLLGRACGDAHAIASATMVLGVIAWQGRHQYQPARRLVEESVALLREVGDHIALAHAISALGFILWQHADWEPAIARLEESLALGRALQNPQIINNTLGMIGSCLSSKGEYSRARAVLGENLALAREQGNKRLLGWPVWELGWLSLFEGDHPQAMRWFEESAALDRESGDRDGEANTIAARGWVMLDQTRVEEARRYFTESLTSWQEQALYYGMAECLHGLAGVAEVEGQPERAARLIGATETLYVQSGKPLSPGDRHWLERYATVTRARLQAGELAQAWSEGRTMTTEQAVAYALGEGG